MAAARLDKFWRALASEKAPFILTAVFAAAGWTVSHTVDRLTKVPLVEYSIKETIVPSPSGIPEKRFRVTLENILSDLTIPALLLVIKASGKKGEKTELTKDSVSFVANEPFLAKIILRSFDGRSAEFNLAELPPGAQLAISIGYTGDAPPRFVGGRDPEKVGSSGGTQGNGTPRFERFSLRTIFVRHEMIILLSGLALLFVLAVPAFVSVYLGAEPQAGGDKSVESPK